MDTFSVEIANSLTGAFQLATFSSAVTPTVGGSVVLDTFAVAI